MNYYSKYLKYKQKYLELKEIAKGGDVNNKILSIDDIIIKAHPQLTTKDVSMCGNSKFNKHCKSKSDKWSLYDSKSKDISIENKGKLDDMCSSLPINSKGSIQTVQNMEAICQCCKKYPRTDYTKAPTNLLRE